MKRFLLILLAVTLTGALLADCCFDHDMAPATCTSPAVCRKCGKVLGMAEDHTEVILSGYKPTCTEPGLTEGSYCAVCGEILTEQRTIPAVGHVSETDPAREATCTEPGLTEGAHCSLCGEILQEQTEIPALGHDWEEATQSQPRTCRRCGLTEGEPLMTEVPVQETAGETAADGTDGPDGTGIPAGEDIPEKAEIPEVTAAPENVPASESTEISESAPLPEEEASGAEAPHSEEPGQSSEPLWVIDDRTEEGGGNLYAAVYAGGPFAPERTDGGEKLRLSLPGAESVFWETDEMGLRKLAGTWAGQEGGLFADDPEAGALLARYARILFSAFRNSNTVVSNGIYPLNQLDRSVECLTMRSQPSADEWAAVLAKLYEEARRDEGLRAFAARRADGADGTAETDFEERLDAAAARTQDTAEELAGLRFELAAGEDCVYALKIMNRDGMLAVYESAGEK